MTRFPAWQLSTLAALYLAALGLAASPLVAWWVVGLVSNLLISLAYAWIAVDLVTDLLVWLRRLDLPGSLLDQVRYVASSSAVRTPASAPVTMIFFSCSVGHLFHAAHLIPWLPGMSTELFEAAKLDHDWHVSGWDLFTAAVGIWYWWTARARTRLARNP